MQDILLKAKFLEIMNELNSDATLDKYINSLGFSDSSDSEITEVYNIGTLLKSSFSFYIFFFETVKIFFIIYT